MRPEELTADRVMIEVDRVVQSNDQWLFGDFYITFIHAPLPNGGAWSRSAAGSLATHLNKKRCVIQIKNKDQMCCARAIVTAKAKIDEHPEWNSIRQGRGQQKEMASALHDAAGMWAFIFSYTV